MKVKRIHERESSSSATSSFGRPYSRFSLFLSTFSLSPLETTPTTYDDSQQFSPPDSRRIFPWPPHLSLPP